MNVLEACCKPMLSTSDPFHSHSSILSILSVVSLAGLFGWPVESLR
jgi:hypothetical protein